MVMKANFFKAIGAGLLLYRVITYISEKKRLFNQLRISINALKVRSINKDSVDFVLSLNLENVTGASLKIGMLDFDVFLDGIKIGTARSNDFIELGSHEKTTVQLNVRTLFEDLRTMAAKFRKLLQNFTGKDVRILGTISVETLPNVYKTINIDYKQSVIDFI